MCLAAVRYKRGIIPIWPAFLHKLTQYTWGNIDPDYQRLFNIKLISQKQLEDELEANIKLES